MAKDKSKEKGKGRDKHALKHGDKYLCPRCQAEVPLRHDCPTCKLEIDWSKI
jgi:predicted amidophosphoribosyltransferase